MVSLEFGLLVAGIAFIGWGGWSFGKTQATCQNDTIAERGFFKNMGVGFLSLGGLGVIMAMAIYWYQFRQCNQRRFNY